MAARSKAWVYGRSLAGIEGFVSRRVHEYFSLVSVVLLGRGLCDGPIMGSEESYQDLARLNGIDEPRRGGLDLIALSIHDNRVYRLYLTEISFEVIT